MTASARIRTSIQVDADVLYTYTVYLLLPYWDKSVRVLSRTPVYLYGIYRLRILVNLYFTVRITVCTSIQVDADVLYTYTVYPLLPYWDKLVRVLSRTPVYLYGIYRLRMQFDLYITVGIKEYG